MRAREIVAERFPQMTAGHRNIPREAVLRGDWDTGKLVQDALKECQELCRAA
jgi:hypothetical protein